MSYPAMTGRRLAGIADECDLPIATFRAQLGGVPHKTGS
jgi:hypothetical protein